MLQSVRFKNFVQFKEYQKMDFSSDGPFIFIGENGSGKSSVLEGIRRCLKLELSTSVSSVFDPNELSYFICNAKSAETDDSKIEEDIIFGIVSIPTAFQENKNVQDECKKGHDEDEMEVEYIPGVPERRKSATRKMSIDEESSSFRHFKRQKSCSNADIDLFQNIEEIQTTSSAYLTRERYQALNCQNVIENKSNKSGSIRYYKFAMKPSEGSPMLIDLIMVDGDSNLTVCESYMVTSNNLSETRKLLFNTSYNKTSEENVVEDSIKKIFENLSNFPQAPSNQLQTLLQRLTRHIVFTFPLRSIGPLQWSESYRISSDCRKDNYDEAEKRCEIIKYFLNDKGKSFDTSKEEKYFQELVQNKEYNFKLIDGKIQIGQGKFALLKTPEGILEAKAFSILMSSNQYKTIILEEPDRGMHPQLIERMILIMKLEKNDKRVMLTTHQKGFITPWTIPYTFIFKRFEKGNQIISGQYIFGRETDANMKKMRLITSHHIPDMLFASKVLFFEGDSEYLFLPELKSQMITGEHSRTLNLLNINEKDAVSSLMKYTLIKMNNKDNRELYHTVADNIQLDHYFLVDRDGVPKILKHEFKSESNMLEILEEAECVLSKSNKDIEELLERKKVFRPIRKILLEKSSTFFWLDGDIERMVTTMCDNDPELKTALQNEKIVSKKDSDHDGVSCSQIEGKFLLHDGIKSKHVKEGVKFIVNHCKQENDLAELIKLLTKKA